MIHQILVFATGQRRIDQIAVFANTMDLFRCIPKSGLRPEPRETLFASPCASHFAEREGALNQDYTEASPDWRILYSPVGGTLGREVRGWRGRF